MTCTVPETLRPCRRAPQRLASQAMVHASSRALNRLATDERGSGTDRPGCTGGRHTWGRQRQDHPPIHSMIPGAGLSADRTAWLPARANCCVPVKALAPIDRALGKEDLRQGGRREDIAPQVWTLPWNGHRQAKPHGPAACTSRAPSGLHGRHRHPSPWLAHGPHGPLHLPASGQDTSTHCAPRRHGVSPPVPPARLA